MSIEHNYPYPHPNPEPTREITTVTPVDEEFAAAYAAIGSQVLGMQVEVHDIAIPEQREQALRRLAQYRWHHRDTASKYSDQEMLEVMDKNAANGNRQLLVYTSALPAVQSEFRRRLAPAKAAALARAAGEPKPELQQMLNTARRKNTDRPRP